MKGVTSSDIISRSFYKIRALSSKPAVPLEFVETFSHFYLTVSVYLTAEADVFSEKVPINLYTSFPETSCSLIRNCSPQLCLEHGDLAPSTLTSWQHTTKKKSKL